MAETKRGAAGILAALALIACSTTTPAPTGAAPSTPPVTPASTVAPSPTEDRNAGWRADLEGLVPAMARLHPDLTHGTTQEALDSAVADLVATIPGATDDELMAGVLRIVAMVSARGCDAHTGAFVWGTGTYPVESLPLRLWLFPNPEGGDDVVVVDALAPYRSLIGGRITTLEGVPIDEVLRRLRALISRDNDETVRLLTPRFLLIPQVLRGLGIDDRKDDVTVTLFKISDTQADVEPIPMADYNAWAGPYGLQLPADPDILYLSRIDDALWWTRLQDGGTVFVQWNRVDHLPLAMPRDLRDALHESDVTRVVLDLRHNYGGEVSAIDPVLELFKDPAIDQPDQLYVITGRNTFSAASLAVAQLDRDTDATIVGEPMGGCPTAYGNSRDVTLPFSGIVVSVATMLEVGVSADDTRLTIEPDIPVQLSEGEWASGSDPVLGMLTTLVP